MRLSRRKLAIGVAAASLLLPSGLAAADAPRRKPMRIMSMNECTDLLVLQLAPASRIASVTYRSHDAVKAVRPGLDAGVAINHGEAEEVLREKPDLILTSDFSLGPVRRLARQVGAPLVEVKSATSFDDIRAATRQVGQAVGELERAEALVAEMDRVLATLKASAPPRPYVVAAWSGESVPGKGTLANAIIEAAGAVNVAALIPNERYNSFGLEELLKVRPEVLMYSGKETGQRSLADQVKQHRAIRKLYAGRQVTYAEPLFECGIPQSANAAADLRRALAAITRGGR